MIQDTEAEKLRSSWDPQKHLLRTFNEIDLMQSYAASEAIVLPKLTIDKLTALATAERAARGDGGRAWRDDAIGSLLGGALEVHSMFSTIVAPVTPNSLRATGGDGTDSTWYRNKLVFYLVLLAGLAVITFTFAVSAGGVLSQQWRDQLSFYAAAMLGATFYSLFTAYKYIVSRTFDPQYQLVYVLRFVLGFVSGVILANFGKDLLPQASLNGIRLSGPVFALIGGYSAEAVNQILLRVGETLVTAVRGGDERQIRAREQEVKTSKAQAAAEKQADRSSISSEINTLLSTAQGASSVDEIRARIADAKTRLENLWGAGDRPQKAE